MSGKFYLPYTYHAIAPLRSKALRANEYFRIKKESGVRVCVATVVSLFPFVFCFGREAAVSALHPLTLLRPIAINAKCQARLQRRRSMS